MLFKVLYTHQKLKKSKTWQDGFLEISPNGRKATLLSEDKKDLDSFFTTIEKVFPDAEIENEKYLIQVEEKFTMEEQKRSAVQQNHQGRPPGIQKVTVKRHGLSSKQRNKQTAFRPPLMDRNATFKSTKNTYVDADSAPVHPSLSGKNETSESGYQCIKNHIKENRSFHNLYNGISSEHKENENNAFSDNLGCQSNSSSQEETTHIRFRSRAMTDENASRNKESSYKYPEPLSNDFTALKRTSVHEGNMPHEPRMVPTCTSSTVKTVKTKRSTSQILALFSKKSKQCYREDITAVKPEEILEPSDFKRTQDSGVRDSNDTLRNFQYGFSQPGKDLADKIHLDLNQKRTSHQTQKRPELNSAHYATGKFLIESDRQLIRSPFDTDQLSQMVEPSRQNSSDVSTSYFPNESNVRSSGSPFDTEQLANYRQMLQPQRQDPSYLSTGYIPNGSNIRSNGIPFDTDQPANCNQMLESPRQNPPDISTGYFRTESNIRSKGSPLDLGQSATYHPLNKEPSQIPVGDVHNGSNNGLGEMGHPDSILDADKSASKNMDSFDSTSKITLPKDSLWEDQQDDMNVDLGTSWTSCIGLNESIDNNNCNKTLAQSSTDFIQPFIKDEESPLPMTLSDHPASLFPNSSVTHDIEDDVITRYYDSADGILLKKSNDDLQGSQRSPVFSSENTYNLDKRIELQSKCPFKMSSSLIKGAVTSSFVRRTEFSQNIKDEFDDNTRYNIPDNDICMNASSFLDDDNNFTGYEESNLGNLGRNPRGNAFPNRSAPPKRKALTCSPTETSNESTRKRSPFAFVPTPNLDVQDDEVTMYSDGELCGKACNTDDVNTKERKPITRRVGLSKAKPPQSTTFRNDFTSSKNLSNTQTNSILPKNGPFKPTYTLSALELGNGAKSMFGELYFPSVDDCEANPIPLRQVRIPVGFNSLSEYKSIFRAALREHLNILLFDLAKNYHTALKKTDINLEFENKLGSKQNGPSCPHGECKLLSVRKDGPNKGRLFFCCPGSAAAQCKFFIWADEHQKKTSTSRPSDTLVSNKINLTDINSVSTFFSGQSLAFYCGCTLLKKSKGSFQNRAYRGRGAKWAKASRHSEDLDTGKKSLYISLPFKGSSSTYGKDDIWIISKNFSFEPKSTFIAKSTFYGPTSSGEVQITAVSSYSPSNWESGETVHALLACNAGTELTCINNLDEISTINEIPVLPHLIFREEQNKRQKFSTNNRFNCPTLKDTKEEDLIPKEIVSQMVADTVCQYGLNEDQAGALKAISSMLHESDNSKESHATLIHGVFGAGKSFLLAVVIVFLVKLFRKGQESCETSEDKDSSWKILVSSTTNVAVDRVLQGLLEIGFDDFVRVGSIKKIAKPVLPYSVHATGSNDLELKELQSLLKSELSTSEKMYVKKSIEKHRFGLNRKKLKEVPVVGVTCAASIFPCMNRLSFKIHLLDECSQMTEPLSLLPIARFRCEKLILVGDPKQLSPTIQGSEADHKFGLERTLFDRLKEKGHQPILLRTQYRCHPKISAVPNQLFYKGQLKDGVTAEQRAPLISWLNSLCFYNVSKGREKCGNDGSYYNEEEAKFVVFLINSMLLFGIESAQIGVITQYKSQVWKISSLLQEKSCNVPSSELRSIQISTVDAFQGAEKEIIILSCVRTDHVGFIDCDRRTNVALSRAKRHLLVVGNLKMLVKNTLWLKIIECCESNKNGVVSALKFAEEMEPRLNEQRKMLEVQSEEGKKKRKKNTASQSIKKQRKTKGTADASKFTETYIPSQDSDSLSSCSGIPGVCKSSNDQHNRTNDKLEELVDIGGDAENLDFAEMEEFTDLPYTAEGKNLISEEPIDNAARNPMADQIETEYGNESEEFPIFSFNLL